MKEVVEVETSSGMIVQGTVRIASKAEGTT